MRLIVTILATVVLLGVVFVAAIHASRYLKQEKPPRRRNPPSAVG